jgi:DNA-directed RNA polymerase specialized sigma24 family protein
MSAFDRCRGVRSILPQGVEGRGDAALISAARAGDAGAYGELTARHAESAGRLARLLVPTDDVDALVAEAFAKVRLVLQRGDGPDLAFRPYLLTAVRRLHIDHGAPASKPDEAPADAAAARAFTSLAEPWRMVLWHTEIEGHGPEQVATFLGESPDSVPALVSRAREGMRVAWLTLHEPTAEKECGWTRHNLGAYVRKVSFERDAARVERHLGGCERCAAICLELTEGTSDLRGILAPLVLGGAAKGYLATAGGPEAPTRKQVHAAATAARTAARTGARARAGAGAAVAGAATFLGRIGDAAAGAASAAAAASSGTTGRVGARLDRARDLVATRTVATAVAGVAAVAVIGAGAFVVVQSTDGPAEARAEAALTDVLDHDATTSDSEASGDAGGNDPAGSGASAERSGSATDDRSDPGSASPSDGPSDGPSDEVSDGASDDPPQDTADPTDPGGPGRASDRPSDRPSEPTRPTRPPTQQPVQSPTQQPTQSPSQQPSQPPTPPTDLSISASSRDLAGLFWGIDVRVTGLAPGRSATLEVRPSDGSATGLTMDRRCSRVSGGGATCRVSEASSTYHFNAQALLGGSNTITFTVYPDGDSDADTGDNSTSVTVRP